MLQLCNDNGFATIVDCIQQELPAFPERPQVAEAPASPTPEELDAQFTEEVNVAISDYGTAYDMAAAGGDYDKAQALASDAASRIEQICAKYGRDPDPTNCIGQVLPQLPHPAEVAGGEPNAAAPSDQVRQRLQQAIEDLNANLAAAQAGDQRALQIAHDALAAISEA
jgi:hypothetical protein